MEENTSRGVPCLRIASSSRSEVTTLPSQYFAGSCHGLADQRLGREVQHAVEAFGQQRARPPRRRRPRRTAPSGDGVGVPGGQVVDDGDLVAGLDQPRGAHASDIAGSAGHDQLQRVLASRHCRYSRSGRSSAEAVQLCSGRSSDRTGRPPGRRSACLARCAARVGPGHWRQSSSRPAPGEGTADEQPGRGEPAWRRTASRTACLTRSGGRRGPGDGGAAEAAADHAGAEGAGGEGGVDRDVELRQETR